jgi:hypothetical protein
MLGRSLRRRTSASAAAIGHSAASAFLRPSCRRRRRPSP